MHAPAATRHCFRPDRNPSMPRSAEAPEPNEPRDPRDPRSDPSNRAGASWAVRYRPILTAFAWLLAAAAVVEFAAALYVVIAGPFLTQIGPLRVSGLNAIKPFTVSVLIGCLAIRLLDAADTLRVRQWAWALVPLGMISLVAPFFLPDFLIGHDGGVHQTYTFLFDRAFQQSQLPVRWIEGVGDGRGQPLFSFYQVGLYYLVELVHHLGPGLSLSLKLTIAGAWTAGAVFMFLLCRPLGFWPGMVAASTYAWTPYLMLDGYVRTAYPELTAVGFAPGVLWSLSRGLHTGRPVYAGWLALSTGVVLISHLPTSVIIAPVCAAYLAGSTLLYRHPFRHLRLVALGVTVGVGMAAFYVIPAIVELGDVKITRLTRDYFDFHLHFVRPEWWWDWRWHYGSSGVDDPERLSLQIGMFQWIVLAAAAALLIVKSGSGSRPQLAKLAGWLTVAGGALFMMTSASAPVWERIGPLTFIQFPWRFLMLPAMACAILAAVVLSFVPRRGTQALLLICAITFQWYVTRDYRRMAWTRPREPLPIDNPAWDKTANARRWVFREPGYDPASVSREPKGIEGRWRIQDGPGDATATLVADARLSLDVRADGPLTLVLQSPFFPGWEVALDGQALRPAIEPGSGYMAVAVPAGMHRVDARFGRTWTRAAADLITLVSLLAWIGLIARLTWTRLRRARPADPD